MKQRALSYPAARAAAVLLSAATFFAVNAVGAGLLGAPLTRDVLSLEHARYFWAIGLAVTAFFAGQSGTLGLLDAYLRGRVRLPPRELAESTPATAQNPWRAASWSMCTWGACAAAMSCWIVTRLAPGGVPLARFAWQFAGCSAALSAAIVLYRSGAPFLEQTRLEPRRRRFAGTIDAYVWQRHVLPQAIVNAIVNAWVGVAIMPVPLHAGHALIPAAFVRLDFAGVAGLLALLIAIGVRGQVQLDQRWGVIATHAGRAPRAGRLFGMFVLVALLGCVTTGLGIREVSVVPYLVARAIGCGLLSATVAYWAAHRTIATPQR